MKLRKFYPAQVVRQLAGRRISSLTASERAALHLTILRSRQYRIETTVLDGMIGVRFGYELGRQVMQELRKLMARSMTAAPTKPSLKSDLDVFADEWTVQQSTREKQSA